MLPFTGVSFDLSDKEILCLEEQQVFDNVYSLIRSFASLPSSSKSNLVETLRSNLAVLLPNVDPLSRISDEDILITSHRNAFKIYTFFLIHILLAQDSCTNTSSKDPRRYLPQIIIKFKNDKNSQ
ncbi:hypothetical protein RJT34_04203 [Clitoria ternatea]|uniref:Condensin complex subunit 1 N-terminal domain-containing protein n=1 Tax=Clitoria ternatea TaxID=43366 RepID=A0AAN9KL61_CLITE